MHAHAQFCMSGDYTLEATEASIKELAREEADEHFVVVLSDANLERYGIRPERFAQVLTSDPQVNAFAIFIGSLGDQAERWGLNGAHLHSPVLMGFGLPRVCTSRLSRCSG